MFLYIFGCGGHGRSVADIYLSIHPEARLLFIDEKAREGETLFGFPVVEQFDLAGGSYFFALGDNQRRAALFAAWGKSGLISICSPKAHYGRESALEAGCFVGNFAHLGPQSTIGYNTIINNKAIVEHEVKVGDHCHIAPGAIVSGRCTLGDLIFLGAGGVIRDQLTICSRVIIGAGSTVVKSIAEPGVYVGSPAKKIKDFPKCKAALHLDFHGGPHRTSRPVG